MARAIGANTRLLMLPETTYGTAPAGNYKRLPFLTCDLGAEQPLLDADFIGLGGTRDAAAPFLDTVTVSGSAVVPVDLINIGHWLRLLLGAPTTTGTTNYTHTFKSGGASLPSNSIEVGYPDVPSYDLITGVRADTLETDFSPSGPATASFGLIGQGSARSGASAGGTPTTPAYTAFNKAQGSISRAGSALAQVTGAKLSFSNGLETVRTIRADRKIEGADPGICRATGQVTARFADTVLLTQAQTGAAGWCARARTLRHCCFCLHLPEAPRTGLKSNSPSQAPAPSGAADR
ncbi:MAG TPA: phage tail tube protein, partial [Acetobacteraceae bacterium]|nr:phage tail tube protein [Acetobacteraceae bacterium]